MQPRSLEAGRSRIIIAKAGLPTYLLDCIPLCMWLGVISQKKMCQ